MEGQKPGQTIAPHNEGQVFNGAPSPAPASPTPPSADRSPYVNPAPTSFSSDDSSVRWTASEFIAHQKSAGWYLMLGLAASISAVVIFLLTRDKITTGVVIFGALAFGIYAARKPRALPYSVDGRGLTVGEKFYPYELFKSFSVMQDGAFSNIYLLPLRRFMPPLTVYYAPQDEDKIVGVLSEYLPYEARKADSIDRLMHRIRF